MPRYDILESILSYVPVSDTEYGDIPDSDDGRATLEDLVLGKVRCLGQIMAEIDEDTRKRTSLSEDVIFRIYQHYLYIKAKLMELYVWPFSGNRAIESRRSALEKQLDALKQEKRKEQVECWKDIAKLRQEARTWFKQYVDLSLRARVVLPSDSGRRSVSRR